MIRYSPYVFEASSPLAENFFPFPVMGRRLVYVASTLFLTLFQVLSAQLANEFLILDLNVSLIWLPSGIGLAALLLFGYRLWIGVALGAFISCLLGPAPWWTAFIMAVSQAMETLAATTLLFYFLRRRLSFERAFDIIVFHLVIFFAACISATLGSMGLAISGVITWEMVDRYWFQWWFGNVMGMIILVPLILTWPTEKARPSGIRNISEFVVIMLFLVGISYFIFNLEPVTDPSIGWTYLIFPFLIWTALRLRTHGAVTAISLVSAIALWSLTKRYSLPMAKEETTAFLTLELFIAVMSFTMLILAALNAERRKAVQAIRQSEARWRSLVELAPNYILTIDKQGEILFLNKTSAQSAKKNYVGENIYQFIPQAYRERLKQAYGHVFRTGEALGCFEIPIERPDGSTTWYRHSFGPVKSDGNVVAVGLFGTEITDLKAKEEAVRSSERHYRLLFMNNPQPMWIVNSQTLCFQNVNKAAIHKYGFDRDEFLRMNFRDLMGYEVGPTIIDFLTASLANALLSEIPQSGACKHRCKDGRLIDVELTMEIIFKEGVPEILIQAHEITERLRLENENRLLQNLGREVGGAEGLYNALDVALNRIGDTIAWPLLQAWIVDESQQWVECSPAFFMDENARLNNFREEYLNLKLSAGEGLPGQVILNKVPLWVTDLKDCMWFHRRQQAVNAGLQTAFAVPVLCGNAVCAVFEFFHYDVRKFEPRTLSIAMSAAYQIGGAIYRKKIEEELKISQDRFNLLTKATKDTVYDWDMKKDHIWWNESFRDMFGFEDGEIGSTIEFWSQLIHPEDRQRVVAHLHSAIQGNREFWSYEYRFQRKDGSYVFIYHRGYITRDGKGNPIRMIGSMVNITERKEIEEDIRKSNDELQRLNQIKSDFTSIVSHELKTPLHSIKEGIQIILDGIDGPVNAEQRDTLTIVKSNVERLARLIRNVLCHSKLESGKMEMTFESVNMNGLLTEVHRLMQPSARKKDIIFQKVNPTEIITAVCDPDSMRQILINLVDNAIKFTDRNGMITMRLYRLANNIAIDVEDTGKGIRKEEQDKIFQMFEQIQEAGIRRGGGVGVGLAVCRYLIQQHHGSIAVNSNPGRGTTFTIVFPDNLLPASNEPHEP